MSDTEENPSSCSGQIAVFGHTSCTVHNIPNNSGSLEFHELDSNILVRYGVLALVGVIGLYFLKMCIDSHFRVKEATAPLRLTSPIQNEVQPNVSRRYYSTSRTQPRATTPTIEII